MSSAPIGDISAPDAEVEARTAGGERALSTDEISWRYASHHTAARTFHFEIMFGSQ